MIEINLVPDVKQELIRAQRIRTKVIIGAIFVGVASLSVVALLAIYVFGVQTARDFIVNDQITNKSDELSKQDLSKALTIQNQLTKISTLNGDKKIDSRIFYLLSKIIPPIPNDIQISDLNIDSATNTIKIDGQASNSYAAVEVFKKTIAGAKVTFTDNKEGVTLASNISTSNTSYGEDSSGKKVLRFTMSFEYPTELFSPSSKDVKIEITANGNVTDSYLGIPPNIFADRAKDSTGSN